MSARGAGGEGVSNRPTSGSGFPESSSRIHRCSLGYWWGGSLPSEQLLLLSRVARWFPQDPPFPLACISNASARNIHSTNFAFTEFSEVRTGLRNMTSCLRWKGLRPLRTGKREIGKEEKYVGREQSGSPPGGRGDL